ncbi:unnamed protein product, partial [Ascophyllum nodosum]
YGVKASCRTRADCRSGNYARNRRAKIFRQTKFFCKDGGAALLVARCYRQERCSYRVMNVRRSYLRIRFNTSWTNHVRACGEV